LGTSWKSERKSFSIPVTYKSQIIPIIFLETIEGVLTPGAYPDRLSNLDLKWETSEQIDLGFDARFLDNALNVTVDVYKKTSKDWLILAPIFRQLPVPMLHLSTEEML
jgi:hypothetical protein